MTHTADVAGFGPVLVTSAGSRPPRTIFDKALDFAPIYGTIRHGRAVADRWETNSNAGRALDVGTLFASFLGDVFIVVAPAVGLTVKAAGKGTTLIRVTTSSIDEAVEIAKAEKLDKLIFRAGPDTRDIVDKAKAVLEAGGGKQQVFVSYRLTPREIIAAGTLDDAFQAAGIRTRGAEVATSVGEISRARTDDIIFAAKEAKIQSIKVRVEIPVKPTKSGTDALDKTLAEIREAVRARGGTGVPPGAPRGAKPGGSVVDPDKLAKIYTETPATLADARNAARDLELRLQREGISAEVEFVKTPKLRTRGKTVNRELEVVFPRRGRFRSAEGARACLLAGQGGRTPRPGGHR